MITQSSNTLEASSVTANDFSVASPIATVEMRAAARAAVVDIARAAPSLITRRHDGSLDPSLGGGAAGVAVFLHYAANALHDADLRATSIDLLDQSLAGLHSLPYPGLYAGYSGVAWAVSHLQQRGVDELDDVDLRDLDAIVETLLGRVPWEGDYDLITGLIGLGVYGLERMQQGAGEGIVSAVVARLAESAEWLPPGAAWFHPPWLVPASQREDYPEGWYNLGVAHGIPGILAFLARAVQYDVRRGTAERLLAAGSLWTCTQVKVVGREQLRLGYQINPSAPNAPATFRDAWCYGSPGAAVALLAAARALGDDRVGACALALARTAAYHDPAQAGVVDASFCHGSSGLAHLYARLHASTGEQIFADAAQRWLAHTLTLKTPGEGVGGFSYDTVDGGGQRVWEALSNLLEGAAGTGLVLLSMCSSEPPAWDRAMLADPAPSLHLASR